MKTKSSGAKPRPKMLQNASDFEQKPQEPEIAKDLLENVGALRAIATIYSLLDRGMYNHNQAHLVQQSLEFVRALHKQVSETALAHPQADLIPELQQLKAKAQGE